MASSSDSVVVTRDRGARSLHLAVRLVIGVWAVLLAWGLEGYVARPLRTGGLGAVLALLLFSSRNLDRSVTVSAEGLRRGKDFWPWEKLSSVKPEPHPRWPTTGPLGGLTLHFGDEAVHFDTSWPLGSLMKAVFTRAPLEPQLQRALDPREREHGLDFGALWLGPHVLHFRREGKALNTVALRDVREVALVLEERPVLRVGEGPYALKVRLAELRDPHVLAALLLRQGAPRHEAPRTPPIEGPPPPEPRSRAAFVSGVVFGILCLIAGFAAGGIRAYGLIQKEWRTVRAERAYWRPVPAEITSSRAWQAPDTGLRQGAVTFRFVLDGTEYEGTRFSPAGTRAEEAERFQAGQRVTAYVPQGQPEQAVLYRSTGDSRLFFVLNMLLPLALLSFCFLFGLSLLAGAFGWDRAPVERPGS